MSVGGILENYDSERKMRALGFGAIPQYLGLNEVCHWFHLNGLPNPECGGVKELLEAYR